MEGCVCVAYQKGNQQNLLYPLCARDCARYQRDKDIQDIVFTLENSWTSADDECTNCHFNGSQLKTG